MKSLLPILTASLLLSLAPSRARAWAYATHRTVNQLALDSLPADFPAFARTPAATERILFLAGEPDRWRSSRDADFLHVENGDHELDLEQLTAAGIDPRTVTSFRYDFILLFPPARAAHADAFPPLEPARDRNHIYQWPGFLPWRVAEDYGRLKQMFAEWKVYRQYGTPEEVADAEADIIEQMGIMGHFVGDSSQPLHVTVHHHGWDCFGWKAPNPNGYTTQGKIHDWIDGTGPGGGFIGRAHITAASLASRVKPARPIDVAPRADGRDPAFVAEMNFIIAQNAEVEPLYRLEKEGKFKADGSPGSFDGKPFVEEQILRGGEMLGAIWLTAWQQAAPSPYLRSDLVTRPAPARSAP
ncbi:MAG TPA: hypothetical protein VHC86_15355 [Opitutaceae bacterium]|nr:hypothetical protein [Opitutaceae bacterium]